MEKVNNDENFVSLNLDKVLKNATPGKIAYNGQIERVQIDALKFERMQIYFLADVSNAEVVVVVAHTPYIMKVVPRSVSTANETSSTLWLAFSRLSVPRPCFLPFYFRLFAFSILRKKLGAWNRLVGGQFKQLTAS